MEGRGKIGNTENYSPAPAKVKWRRGVVLRRNVEEIEFGGEEGGHAYVAGSYWLVVTTKRRVHGDTVTWGGHVTAKRSW